MTNEELKEKICDIIAPYVSAYGDDERIADALIAAGIGDVSEWKQSNNYWEQQFESKQKQYNELTFLNNKIVNKKDEIIAQYKHRAEVAHIRPHFGGRLNRQNGNGASTRPPLPYF